MRLPYPETWARYDAPADLRGLSLSQPWASLVAAGLKPLETRGTRTKHRGPILICSAIVGNADGVIHLFDRYGEAALTLPKIPDWGLCFTDARFPTGCAMAIAEIVDCRPLVPADEPRAFVPWRSGRWVWELANIRRVKPFPVRGMMGLFPLPPRVLERLEIAA